jgi:hypothetical protein
MTFMGRPHLAPRQTLGPWSLIRAVGLPQMCQGYSFDEEVFSVQLFLHRLLPLPLSVLSRPYVARHMRSDTT